MNNNLGRLIRYGLLAILLCLKAGLCFGAWNLLPGPTDQEYAYKVHQVDLLKGRFGCVMYEVHYPPAEARSSQAAQQAADLQYSEFRIKVAEQLGHLPTWWKENEDVYGELVAAWRRAKQRLLEDK